MISAGAPFEAARKTLSSTLPPEKREGPTLHGHSFFAQVKLECRDNNELSLISLEKNLSSSIALLNYQYLNEVLDTADAHDCAIATWLLKKLPYTERSYFGVQSTRGSGAELIDKDNVLVWKRYDFFAAHQLPNVPRGHKCGEMHGHSFGVRLTLKLSEWQQEPLDNLDFQWRKVENKLNFNCLNNIQGLENPTSEVIARWIWRQLKARVRDLVKVTIYETPTVGAYYDGERFGIWKELSFDSAINAPPVCVPEEGIGGATNSIFGLTYLLRLHFNADLDDLLGWTIDYGEIKKAFEPIFGRLDHKPIYKIKSLQSTSCLSLSKWISEEAKKILPHLSRVELYEKRGCGVTVDLMDVTDK